MKDAQDNILTIIVSEILYLINNNYYKSNGFVISFNSRSGGTIRKPSVSTLPKDTLHFICNDPYKIRLIAKLKVFHF